MYLKPCIIFTLIMEDDKIYFDLQRVPLASERNEKRQRRRKTFLIFLLCLILFVLGGLLGYFIYGRLHRAYEVDTIDVLGEIEYDMDNYWLYSSDYDNLIEVLEDKAYYGMTSFDYDPYTQYMSEQEMLEFSTSINMDYVGIGVEYSNADGSAIVKRVFKNSPAEKAGILPGDIIVAVDGVSIQGFDHDQIREKVLGEKGTKVTISLERTGTSIDVDCIRDSIYNTAHTYEDDGHLILELSSFGNTTADEISTYLDEYTDRDELIIDLRDDTGGYQNSVKEVCGLFVGNDKVYLKQKDSKGKETVDYTRANKVYDNFKKIVIIINENTASAAEVFALCLKEIQPNTTIVGTTSFGKGVIQTNRALSNGGILKLTAYYWYSPSGKSIHEVGIKPDVEVMMPQIAYEHYYELYDDESYGLDTVSEACRISQLSLELLGYDISRTDGYFDSNFENALMQFKKDNNIDGSAILDSDTYSSIISSAVRELATNLSKDTQLNKAKEVLDNN